MNYRVMVFINLYNFKNILIMQAKLEGQEELTVIYIKYMKVYVNNKFIQ